jgi:hypothetical protein
MKRVTGRRVCVGLAPFPAQHFTTATEAQIAALRTGATGGDAEIDALTRVVREAAGNSGNVTDVTWKSRALRSSLEIRIGQSSPRCLS